MGEKIKIVGTMDPASHRKGPAIAEGLLLHKFIKADSRRGALTPDASGTNLPSHGSPWIYAKEVVVAPSDRRVGPTSLQITSGVTERGYFLFPISDDV